MIHMYPGLGATSAMYGPLWRRRIAGVFHDWPVWRGEKTLGLLAERLVEEAGIDDGDMVIGSSLGGMVACEIARHRRLKAVVLIGSATRQEEIARCLAWLHPLVGVLPLGLMQTGARRWPHELTRMFAQVDPAFVRAMTRAIFCWKGLDVTVPIVRIHGRRDRIIPLPERVDVVVEGGHLLAMTQPTACIAAIERESLQSGLRAALLA